MKFSDRVGITKIKTELQINSINDVLKVRIYNIIIIFLIDRLKYHIRESGSLYEFIRLMWHYFLKLDFDEIPPIKDSFNDFLKQYFIEFEWYEVYNFLEFLYQELPYDNEKFKECINIVLEEELSNYRIIGKEVVQITDEKEIEEIEEALLKSKENKLSVVNKHLDSALSKFSDLTPIFGPVFKLVSKPFLN